MRPKTLILIVACLVVMGLIYKEYNSEPESVVVNQTSPTESGYPAKTIIKVNDFEIEVWLAQGKEEKQRGLSGFKSLADNQGMLFLESHPNRPSFWMKEMLFPIDIIWIDSELKVADITKNISPDTYPDIYRPDRDVAYVLEVNANWADEHNLNIGDAVELPNDLSQPN